MDDKTFLDELRQIVIRRATVMHLVDTMAFVSEVAERLEDDPVFGELVPLEFSGTGSRNRQLRVHGFTRLDESDGTIGLVIGKWSDADEPGTLTTQSVNQLTGWLESFVAEAIESKLSERIAEVNSAYELACQLQDQGKRINRIRLHVFSNQSLSQKFKEEQFGTVAGIPIERHIWDLQRLKATYESSREREAVQISLAEFGSNGIPCLEAARTDSLRSFLCVMDATLLADLFEHYGSRLLEGNVRSFLGMKGGVNKGIRSTIQDSPSLFFAYNNGIAATAANLTVQNVDGRHLLTGMIDFQIVNGGQTTASILNARKKDRLSLSGVTIQMKLTEVSREDAHDLIPKIAQFANTQNKIDPADFFANHPFHIKIAEISRRLQVPAKAGARIQSKWFYERSRGQFQSERLYLTKAKKDAFDLEYPTEQLINKTELAKYDSVWREKPHWVSLAAQKNFTKFADQFSNKNIEVSEREFWDTISPNYGESYYRHMVSVAILWRRVEIIVSAGRGGWYLGGYRPQIVAYSLSLLFHSLRCFGRQLNLSQVWAKQGIDSSLEDCLRNIAIEAQAVILNPPAGMTNVGEWAKKEACWENVKQLTIHNSDHMEQWAVSKEEFNRTMADGRKLGKQDDGITLQKRVLQLTTSGYWSALLKWTQVSALLLPVERTLVIKASTTHGFMKVNVEKDWRKLLEIQHRCEEEGFRPPQVGIDLLAD
ncbi:AIPR family protein [Roseateles oligotrophus]|uniref:AIPR family protein n=1 Tax=Roseateles oligotrophus TaxID=1769250 RepID=A0ABT2YCA1_9BURK|nr:AIPR family protein [Roseateles oligotrophus]MCV2367673.1 AIPR family protein [Roseateles oligotrophus]